MVLQSYKFKIKDVLFIVVGTENVRTGVTIDTVLNTSDGVKTKYNRHDLLKMIREDNAEFI